MATVDVAAAVVFTEKVADVAPPATVTLGGTAAAALSLESVTTAPLAGAGPLIVTVPIEVVPTATVAGSKLRDESTAGLMVSVVELVPLRLAEIVADVMELTPAVRIGKLAAVAPPGTVRVSGTCAAMSVVDSVTEAPPAGAGPLRVTVPVEDAPPVRVFGLNETDEIVAGLIVRVAVLAPP